MSLTLENQNYYAHSLADGPKEDNLYETINRVSRLSCANKNDYQKGSRSKCFHNGMILIVNCFQM
jgi:hypothetical protein